MTKTSTTAAKTAYYAVIARIETALGVISLPAVHTTEDGIAHVVARLKANHATAGDCFTYSVLSA